MKRRIGSGVVVLVGVALIVVALVAQLFTRSPAFEELTDDFRSAMTTESIDQMQADLEGMQAMSDELQTDVMPALAGALGMTSEELTGMLDSNFPAVSTGMQQLPAITENFMGMASTLSAQQGNFEAADAIPTSSLPATTIPWGVLAAALVAIAAGVFMFTTKRAGAYAALVLGIALIAGPLILSLTTKAGRADDMKVALQPIMTTEQATQAQGALAIVGDMGTEMQEGMMPALSEQMHISLDEVNVFMQGFPATGGMLQSFPEVQARFDGFVKIMTANVDNYDTIKPLSLEPIVWILVAAGLMIGVAGGLSLFAPAPVQRTKPAAAAH